MVLLGSLVVLSLAACGAGDPDAAPPIDPAAYSALIDEFLPPAPAEGEPKPIVYVAMLGDEPLSLDDQVAVIEVVDLTHELRFVDDTQAAIDDEDTDAPPRDEGVLLGIGKIPREPPHTARVEVYSGVDQVDASLVTLQSRTDSAGQRHWTVSEVELVVPEVLVGDE